MPAMLGPLAGFALGVLLAWLRGEDADREGSRDRALAIVALFAVLVFAPVNTYFLAFAGDWSFAYLIDSNTIPSALGLCLIVVDAALVVAGFALARRYDRSRPLGAALGLLGAAAGILLIVVLALLDRLRIDATFHQFRGDFGAQPIAGGPLGYALIWMDGILLAGVVLTARALSGREGTLRSRAIEGAGAAAKPEEKKPSLGGRRVPQARSDARKARPD